MFDFSNIGHSGAACYPSTFHPCVIMLIYKYIYNYIEKISKFIVERVTQEIIVRLFLKEFSRPPPYGSLVPKISFFTLKNKVQEGRFRT
jgi:hypothetical protein